jgi:excisionase family DNA binding protein
MSEAVLSLFPDDYSAVIDIMAAADSKLAQMIEDHNEAITVPQLAAILKCSRREVYKLISNKRIPALRVGSMIRLDPSQVADWVRSKGTII